MTILCFILYNYVHVITQRMLETETEMNKTKKKHTNKYFKLNITPILLLVYIECATTSKLRQHKP
jgi:hypothetical protein